MKEVSTLYYSFRLLSSASEPGGGQVGWHAAESRTRYDALCSIHTRRTDGTIYPGANPTPRWRQREREKEKKNACLDGTWTSVVFFGHVKLVGCRGCLSICQRGPREMPRDIPAAG